MNDDDDDRTVIVIIVQRGVRTILGQVCHFLQVLSPTVTPIFIAPAVITKYNDRYRQVTSYYNQSFWGPAIKKWSHTLLHFFYSSNVYFLEAKTNDST